MLASLLSAQQKELCFYDLGAHVNGFRVTRVLDCCLTFPKDWLARSSPVLSRMGTSMAITGPHFKSFSSGTGLVEWQRHWYRQSRPYVLRLPQSFRHRQVTLIRSGSLGSWGSNPVSQLTTFASTGPDIAYSKALEKFSKGIRDTAELGNALAEKAKSVRMIVARVEQLLEFTTAIKKGRFGDAAMSLGITLESKPSLAQQRLWSKKQDALFKWRKSPLKYPPRNARPEPSKAKGAANNWLEFWFGWKPLITDIYQACKNLQDGIPPVTVKGFGYGEGATRTYGDYGFAGLNSKTKCQIIADVRVINPMAHMLSQMGLTNPFAVLWEITPWSFVLDWLSNAGQFLTAWTGYPGVVVSNGAYTLSTKWRHVYRDTIPGFTPRVLEGTIFSLDRNTFPGTPPHPPFVIYNFNGMSPTRGASAIALLVQRMKSL